MVITRQRPGTAKGFVFLTLEDETGIANIIVQPDLFARDRLMIVEEPFLMVEGVLQNQEGVTSVRAEADTRTARGLGRRLRRPRFLLTKGSKGSKNVWRPTQPLEPSRTSVSASARGGRAWLAPIGGEQRMREIDQILEPERLEAQFRAELVQFTCDAVVEVVVARHNRDRRVVILLLGAQPIEESEAVDEGHAKGRR
jgi:hypothetical protein